MSRVRYTISAIKSIIGLISLCVYMSSCGTVINTENDSHFDDKGYAIYNQQDSVVFAPTEPTKVKFYFEVSGSMNGFFRSNAPTGFKEDVNSVLNKCSAVSEIYVMKDLKGEHPIPMDQATFVQSMNSGAFGSSPGSTLVPYMIENILANLDADNGEVAVFISDMIYDPTEDPTAKVLATQYGSNMAKILHRFEKSVSLVCATSNYLRKAVSVTAPYYFLIIGNGPQVARVRNLISAILYDKGRFVDNIESGFDFGRPVYSFGVPRKCYQMDDKEPTFVAYEEAEDGDTCTIKINIPLENYRWLLMEKNIFDSSFVIKSKYGTDVTVSDIKIDTKKCVAMVIIKVFNMVTDSEVLEWGLELPDRDYTRMVEFLEDANNPNDPTKSYSVKNFCQGMTDGLSNSIKPNYILISKKN